MTKEQMEKAYQIAEERPNLTAKELIQIGFQTAINGEVILNEDNKVEIIG